MMFSFFNRKSASAYEECKDIVGYFGKMPIAVEQISHHIETNEIYEFDRRINDAVRTLEKRKQQGIGPTLERLPIVNFLFSAFNQKNASTGVLFASKDKKNNAYPFVIFSVLRDVKLINQLSVVPMLAHEFLLKAAELSAMDWSKQTVENLSLSIESLSQSTDKMSKANSLAAQVELLKGTKAVEFWKGLNQFSEQRSQAFYLSALQALMNMILSNRLSKTVSAIRLPIPNGPKQKIYVIFLIQLLSKCLNQQIKQVKFFWYQGNDHYASSLIFYFRQLNVSGIMELLDRTSKENSILDLDKTIESLSDPTRQSLNIVRQQNGSLMEALFHWKHLMCPS